VWRKNVEKLLNEENLWDNNVACEKLQGQYELLILDFFPKKYMFLVYLMAILWQSFILQCRVSVGRVFGLGI